jgi:hypothetical protein
MRKNSAVLLALFILTALPAYCVIIPPLPSGRLGKDYQTYGFLPVAIGIGSRPASGYTAQGEMLALRSNFGSDKFDFGLGIDLSTPFFAVTADIKYGVLQAENAMVSADLAATKPFPDSFILKIGPALNLSPFNNKFDFVFAAFYQYNFRSLTGRSSYSVTVTFPAGSSYYFYSGIELPIAVPDSVYYLGLGYLYAPGAQQAFNGMYLQSGIKYPFGLQKNAKKPAAKTEINVLAPEGMESAVSCAERAKGMMKTGQYALAEAALVEGLSYFPDDYLLNSLMGNCFYRTGEKKKAYFYYKKASNINPDDIALQDFLKQLYMELKNEK